MIRASTEPLSYASALPRSSLLTSGLGLRAAAKRPPAPPVATPSVTLSHDRAPLGSPIDITYKFVVANDAQFAEDYRVMVHVVDADDELIFDLRSQSADADDAVEAGADGRVHAHGCSSRSIRTSAKRRSRSGCTRRQSEAAAARRARMSASTPTRSRSSSCSRRPRTCSRSSRTAGTRPKWPSTTRRRVAVDEEGRDAVVQEPEERLALLFRRRQPGQRVQRAAAGAGQPRRPGRGRVHAQAERAGAAEDPAQGGAARHRRRGGAA